MATQFKIEKGVPLPQTGARGRVRIYPFGDLEPGDSFLGPDAAKFQRAVSAYATRHGINLITRKVDGGIRVWRLK